MQTSERYMVLGLGIPVRGVSKMNGGCRKDFFVCLAKMCWQTLMSRNWKKLEAQIERAW